MTNRKMIILGESIDENGNSWNVGVPLPDLQTHAVVFGSTGSGKSSAYSKNKPSPPWTEKSDRLTKFLPKNPKNLADETSSQHRSHDVRKQYNQPWNGEIPVKKTGG